MDAPWWLWICGTLSVPVLMVIAGIVLIVFLYTLADRRAEGVIEREGESK